MQLNRDSGFIQFVYFFSRDAWRVVPGQFEEVEDYHLDPETLSYDCVTRKEPLRGHTHIPYQTSLCALFWRSVVMCVLAGISLAAIGIALYAVAKYWKISLPVAALATSFFIITRFLESHSNTVRSFTGAIGNTIEAGVEGTVYLVDKLSSSTAWTIFWGGVKAVKSKMCPIVDLVGEVGK